MSAPVASSAATSAASASTSSRRTANTASMAQGAADAPTDLFQDLMQALSVTVDAAVLPGTRNPPMLADDRSSTGDKPLAAEPADNLALPTDCLGLLLAQTLPTLPPAVPALATGSFESQALPPSDLALTATALNAGCTVSESPSPTQALLDMVLNQPVPCPTNLSLTVTTSPLATPTQQSPAQDLATVNLMVGAEQTTGKAAKPGWATAIDPATAGATSEGQVPPLDPTPQPAMPAMPDAGMGIRPSTSNAQDTPGLYRNALQAQPWSPEFPTELVSEVQFLLKGGLQRAELRMNPVELGPIQIELRLNAQVADIGFTAAHAATREGIAQTLPQLREMLSSQGLSMGHTSVGAQAQGQQQAQQDRTPPDTSPGHTVSAVGSASIAMRVGGAARLARGVLDLYA